MKVAELAILLDSLTQGLHRVKGGAGIASDLGTFADVLGPFAERTVVDFTGFLRQCEEYQRTGVVSGKPARPRKPAQAEDPELAANAVRAVQALLDEIDRGAVSEQRIEDTLRGFEKYTKPKLDEIVAGLNIAGKMKTKALALEKIRQLLRSQLEMADKVRTIRDGAPREQPALP